MSNSVPTIVRYTNIKDVPIMPFAVFDGDHPDIEIIKKAYESAGAGLGIMYKKGISEWH